MTPEKKYEWMTAKQLANRYDVSVATVWRWSRDRADFPKPVRIGDNCTRFKVTEIESWEAALQGAAS